MQPGVVVRASCIVFVQRMVNDTFQVRESTVFGFVSSSRERKAVSIRNRAPFPSSNARETEYFWLREPCSAGMTLRLVRDGAVAAIGLADTLCSGPHVALNAVDRENGAFLRSVSFLPRSHPKGT